MSFPEKPTTKDLSDTAVLKRFPGFDSSMSATNTITDKLEADGLNSGQGTPSEATQDVVSHNANYVGFSHQTPDLPGPDAITSGLSTDEKGSAGHDSAIHPWKEV